METERSTIRFTSIHFMLMKEETVFHLEIGYETLRIRFPIQ